MSQPPEVRRLWELTVAVLHLLGVIMVVLAVETCNVWGRQVLQRTLMGLVVGGLRERGGREGKRGDKRGQGSRLRAGKRHKLAVVGGTSFKFMKGPCVVVCVCVRSRTRVCACACARAHTLCSTVILDMMRAALLRAEELFVFPAPPP